MIIDRHERARILLDQFTAREVILVGNHFLLSSGKHSLEYFAKDIIYSYPALLGKITQCLMDDLDHYGFDVMVGPEKGGIILSGATSILISKSFGYLNIRNAFAEKKTDGTFYFGRDYDKLIAGKRIAIVEDVLTTGDSVAGVIKEVIRLGGEVVVVGAICNRGGVTAEKLGVPALCSLLELNIPTYDEVDCVACQKGTPFNQEFGHCAKVKVKT
ncbi:MAG: hypothetical protein COX77_00455 [Candidatus Komeilibacteria bacterium CG_4_10_14_0_2_um_filter_37_10]|uniref:Orotate phosphoribosyltransferase n=1 Tax=Candidatus Komeilibacteria bacterium CG_4_10_14_0_2_um_filter_37_10 TaxID=1974470 RepID=A0A2M7VGE7_9BACT|nr:MAG: hypothetical protein COX77_00455 [Candidatus Komeilibacteria bacterium CG_4_10_14_0_2_um_filter_37_10]